MFLFQGAPPDIVNSPSAASNQQTNEVFPAGKDASEEVNREADVESQAKDLNKQFAMAVAHPTEAGPPTSDDEKLKLLLDGLQNMGPHALQILAAAAQNASQKLEGKTSKEVEGESSKQGRGGKELESRKRRRLSQKAVRFDPLTELDTPPGKANAEKFNVREASRAKPKSKATTQVEQSCTSSAAVPVIKAERKRGTDGRYLQEEDAYTSDIQKAVLDIVGKLWNNNKYWSKNLRENWTRLAESKRWGDLPCPGYMKVFRWLVKAENDSQSLQVDMSNCGDAQDGVHVREPRQQEVPGPGEEVPRLLPMTKDEEALLQLLQTSEVIERIRES